MDNKLMVTVTPLPTLMVLPPQHPDPTTESFSMPWSGSRSQIVNPDWHR